MKKLTTELFINKSKEIHGNKYNYSYSIYKNNRTKIKIICPIHGLFEQSPSSHMRGFGCAKCAGCKKLTEEEFINKSKKIHGNKYNYSLVEYINSHKKIIIICEKHGVFSQLPNKHLCGRGCPKCNNSRNEILIENILNKNNIKYIQQMKFDNCKYKNKLPFDFYLPNQNICIEFDGEQHFRKHKIWGEEKFKNKIKTSFCKENNIKLIRIKYNDDIEKRILTEIENFKI